MTTFNTITELNELLEKSLANAVDLETLKLFYNAIKEQAAVGDASDSSTPAMDNSFAQLNEESLADTSRIELEQEQDDHYTQMIEGLQKDIRAEQETGDELRQVIRNTLLSLKEAEQKHSEDNLHDLEAECAKAEALLEKYTKSAERVDPLKATTERIQNRQSDVAQQLIDLKRAYRESLEYSEAVELKIKQDKLRQSEEARMLQKFIDSIS